MKPARDCGACNLCCKLLNVPDIHKPAQMTCWATTIHGGCTRQAEKPDPAEVDFDEATGVFTPRPSQVGKDLALLACAQFRCLWLDSQTNEDPELRLGRQMRPDVTHVVLGPQNPNDETLLHVNVDPAHPGALHRDPIRSYLNEIFEQEVRLQIIIGDNKFEMSEPF